jgi:hemin uptake protein HemP
VATKKSGADLVDRSVDAAPSRDGADPSSRRIVKSSELLAGRSELNIEHNGELYLLRRTSNGKLILTK